MPIFDRFCRKDTKITMKKLITAGIIVFVSAALISLSGCAEEQTTREGYKTYSKYGFSFEYPQSFLLYEQGILESQANDTSGMVFAGVENEEVKYIFAGWIKTQEQFVDLEGGIEGYFQGLEEGEDIAGFERGELVETTKAGHRMLYQYYTATDTATDTDGDKVFGIFGTWYCDKDQKVYMLYTINNTVISKEDVLADYKDYLDHFICH